MANVVQSIKQRVERVFAPSKTETNPFQDLSGGMGGVAFESIGDFINFYKSEAFNIAYKHMDPFSCYIMAMGNSWLSSTISAVARPLAASQIVAMPNDPEYPDNIEVDILNDMMKDPNPDQDDYDFKYELAWDFLCTGTNYIEIAYDNYGYPRSLYRHLPYLITKLDDGTYRHKNGYIFQSDEMIQNKYFNPFSNKVGMSPIVPLVASVMLDSSILNTNLKNFEGGPKGLLSMDKSIPASIAQKEIKRIQETVAEMKKKKESNHLAVFAMTWQAIGMSNKDAMTPEMEKSIQTRICSVYGVPPAKVSVIDSGNIGGGTGESQDESMNETLNFWGKKALLGGIQQGLIKAFQFENTYYDFKDLTKKDERRLADLDNVNLLNGSTTLNRVLAKRGEPLYDHPLADEPLIPSNLIPLSALEKLLTEPEPEPNPINPVSDEPPEDDNEDDGEEDDDMINDQKANEFLKMQNKVLKKLEVRGDSKAFVVYRSIRDEL
jgi:HK97 family phage portal protein